MSKKFYCDGLKDCEDGRDEPESCAINAVNTLSEFVLDFKKLYAIVDPQNTYGPVFGGISGIMLLFFTILIVIVLVIAVCVCNKNCPVYKWRQRRGQPPVGVIVADVPNEATLNLTCDKDEDCSAYDIIGIVTCKHTTHDCNYVRFMLKNEQISVFTSVVDLYSFNKLSLFCPHR